MLTEFKDSDSAIRARLRKLGFKATACPPDWRETLRACDFHLAKRELQKFFHYAAEQALARQGEGGRCIYRVEFVRGWEVFAERPCYDTAVAFIEGAPDYADLIWAYFWAYLIECCPGGMLLKDAYNRRPEMSPSDCGLTPFINNKPDGEPSKLRREQCALIDS
jgi:hypothetical protein